MEASLARMLIDGRQWAEARSLLEGLVERQRKLLSNDPRRGSSRILLASGYRSLAEVLKQTGEKVRAAEALRKAGQLRAEHFPGPPGFRDRRRDRR